MVATHGRIDGKRNLDSGMFTAQIISLCNNTQKERSSSITQDSGSLCEPMHKKPKRVGLASQVTKDVCNDASELIQKVEETHKKRMAELIKKQNMEILEYFMTKNERKELLDKRYQLEKDVLCEHCGESSSSKEDILKQLDEQFKIKVAGLRREMDKRWKDLMVAHLTAKTNEEEIRRNNIEMTIHSLEDSELSSPVSPIQDLSPEKRLSIANENVEISPYNFPIGDIIAKPADPDKQMDRSTVPASLSEPVSSNSSPVKEVTLDDDENQVRSMLITDSQTLNESGQSASIGYVLIGSDDKQIYMKPVPVPISPSIEQLDVLSIPVTPDHLNRSALSLGQQCPIYNAQSSEVLAASSVTIRDITHKENTLMCLDSDDEQMHEISAAINVYVLKDANNLLAEAPGISSEACLSAKENQQQGAGSMLGGDLGIRGSSSCEALPCGGQGSMNQDTIVGDLGVQIQENATTAIHRLFSMTQHQFIDQSCRFPFEQLPPTQLPSSEIRVTGESFPSWSSSSSSSCQDVIDNYVMMHPTTSVSERNVRTQLSDITSNDYLNRFMSPYVSRPTTSCQRSSFDPLQIELAKINEAGYAAKKNSEDMLMQLELAREEEIAQIRRKYGLLLQEAENDAKQKRKELELRYEKTKAHMLLAKAWAMEIDVSSPIFHPSTQFQLTGMPTNAISGLVNQFSGTHSINRVLSPQNPPPYQNLNPEAGWGSYIPNPYIYPSYPTQSIPLHLNQYPLNFSSPGSSAGYFSQFYC